MFAGKPARGGSTQRGGAQAKGPQRGALKGQRGGRGGNRGSFNKGGANNEIAPSRGNTRGGRGGRGARGGAINRQNYNSFKNTAPDTRANFKGQGNTGPRGGANVKRLSGGLQTWGNNKPRGARGGANDRRRAVNSNLANQHLKPGRQPGSGLASNSPSGPRGAETMLKKQQEQLRQLQMLAQNQQLLQRQMQQLQNIQTKQNEILLNNPGAALPSMSSRMPGLGNLNDNPFQSSSRMPDRLSDRDVLMF